ncbi:MAG TPA: KTSC domain-containing protein [Blastocatellia bacterium]|nr:KTSC domain-containing protein [Blastocatellia bacterium]
MRRTPVESSVIASIGYDAEAEAVEIEFNHGPIYLYRTVPFTVHEEFINAPSKGIYFNTIFRQAGYSCEKIFDPSEKSSGPLQRLSDSAESSSQN